MDLIWFSNKRAFEEIQEEWLVPTCTLGRSLRPQAGHGLEE